MTSEITDSEYEEAGGYVRQCPRCQCCDTDWTPCYNCEDGFSEHDCGDDTCCCLHPVDNVQCDICEGKGGWRICIGDCDKDGKHATVNK